MEFMTRNFLIFVFFIFAFFIFINGLKFIFNWLKINHKKNQKILKELKIYFETVVMFFLSIMSIIVSIIAITLSKEELFLQNKQFEISSSPNFYIEVTHNDYYFKNIMNYYNKDYLVYNDKGHLSLNIFDDFDNELFNDVVVNDNSNRNGTVPYPGYNEINFKEIKSAADRNSRLIDRYNRRFNNDLENIYNEIFIYNDGAVIYNCDYIPFSTILVNYNKSNTISFIIDDFFLNYQKNSVFNNQNYFYVTTKSDYIVQDAYNYLIDDLYDNNIDINIHIQHFLIIDYQNLEGIRKIELYRLDSINSKCQKIDIEIDKLFPNFRNEDEIYFNGPFYKLADFYNGKLKEAILDRIEY